MRIAVLILATGALTLTGCENVEGHVRESVARMAQESGDEAAVAEEPRQEPDSVRGWKDFLTGAAAARCLGILESMKYDSTLFEQRQQEKKRLIKVSYESYRRAYKLTDHAMDLNVSVDSAVDEMGVSLDFLVGLTVGADQEKARKEVMEEINDTDSISSFDLAYAVVPDQRFDDANCHLIGR